MDDSAKLLIGVGLGAAVTLGLLAIMRNANQNAQTQPQFVSHNVVRDDRGRIQNVETFSGMGQTTPQQPATPQYNQPAMIEYDPTG